MGMLAGSWATRSVATRVVATDGSGDFTTIQEALNDLPSTGGAVYVKEGTYTITSPISIPYSNISIIGAALQATHIVAGAAIDLIDTNNKHQLYISRLQLSGYSTGMNWGIDAGSSVYCTINECWFYGCRRGVNLDSSVLGFTIRNCIFDVTTQAWSIYLKDSKYVMVQNNVFRDPAYRCFELDGSDNNTITGNIIYMGGQNSIHLTGSDSNVINNNTILNIDAGYHCIYLDTGSVNNVINSNRLDPNKATSLCIFIGSGCNNNYVVGNNINGTHSSNGITDSGTGNVIVSGITAPQTEQFAGSDCTGSDGDTSRVLTLSNTTISSSELVVVDGMVYRETTDYTVNHLSSSTTITFTGKIWDTQNIEVRYYGSGNIPTSGITVPQTESFAGSDCDGTDGATGRTLTLSNTSTSSNELVAVDGMVYRLTTDYTISHLAASTTVTFAGKIWDSQAIDVRYYV